MTWEQVHLSEEILGRMAWVVNLQQVLVSLHVVNVGVAAVILVQDHASWVEIIGCFVASAALSGTSWFARCYQQRLGRELDRVLSPEGDMR